MFFTFCLSVQNNGKKIAKVYNILLVHATMEETAKPKVSPKANAKRVCHGITRDFA